MIELFDFFSMSYENNMYGTSSFIDIVSCFIVNVRHQLMYFHGCRNILHISYSSSSYSSRVVFPKYKQKEATRVTQIGNVSFVTHFE